MTPDQPSLLDQVVDAFVNDEGNRRYAGIYRKARGQQQVLDHEKERFKHVALAVIRRMAREGREFTVDDVRAVLATKPFSDNSWGAVFSQAAKAGIIECVSYRKSTKKSRHASVVRVWRGRNALEGEGE